MSGLTVKVVTGVGLALAGVTSLEDLRGPVEQGAGPVDPAERIGKKGLRYKDRATQLALVAAHDALQDAGLLRGAGREAVLTVPAADVGVVVSSNFGNLDSVCDTVQGIAANGNTRLVSPITTPNLSSNVIASEVAIRFGLRGPNLMVCNGPSSGLDAIHWAATMLGSGRARQILVLGAEPDNPVVRRLTGHAKVLDGAVALVVEQAASAAERDVPIRAELGRYTRTDGLEACLRELAAGDLDPADWYVPQDMPLADQVLAGVARHDLTGPWGHASGALGVLQCAAAVSAFDSGAEGAAYAVAGSAEATAGLVLRPGR